MFLNIYKAIYYTYVNNVIQINNFKNCITIFIFLLLSNSVNSQVKSLVLEKMLGEKIFSGQISQGKQRFPFFIDSTYPHHYYQLFKLDDRLFIWFTNTGRIYEAKKENRNNKINFDRLDTTKMEGYNLLASAFGFNGNLFNMGGYGFWRTNGQLRVFNSRIKEWDIIKINKEIAFVDADNQSLIWKNLPDGKLYLAFPIIRDQAVNEEIQKIPRLFIFDIEKREWVLLGSLTKSFIEELPFYKIVANIAEGLLIASKDQLYLLSFKQNKLFKADINNKDVNKIIKHLEQDMFFSNNEKLFIGSPLSDNIDSVDLNRIEWTTLSFKVFKKDIDYLTICFFIIFIGISSITSAYYKKKKKIKESIAIREPFIDMLQENDLNILIFILKCTQNGKNASIEELNRVMGLQSKAIDIQKKQRSDNLKRINQVVSLMLNSNELAILKERSPIDKRSFEYYINPVMIKSIEYFLNKKNSTTT